MNTAKQNLKTIAIKAIDRGKLTPRDLVASRTVDLFLDIVGCRSTSITTRTSSPLAIYPRILLMDEPFAALDYQTSLMMQDSLLNLWEEFDTTMVFVMLDVDESIFLSERILLMRAAPRRIVKDNANSLPRPRYQMISSEAEFLEIKRECMEFIRAESVRTFKARLCSWNP